MLAASVTSSKELVHVTWTICDVLNRTPSMNPNNVIPFRKRPAPPSEAELERYRQATRNWHPEMRRRLFPEHYEIELKYAED
jgi:hypothetical protein